ncbi:hypothetical protein [Actinomadura soli]|uniref:hypothetical protein n=1 Tax=Actinomadura soli TaxID=2508997 RepID=UPI001E428E9A|nr:hypothetical protein [Actinomadura soli]
MGDAAHTAHFSVGSGTTLAMDDAITLATELTTQPRTELAFQRFEEQRRPIVERLQMRAEASRLWWETMGQRLDRDAADLAFHYLTRTGALSFDRVRVAFPDLARTVRAGFDDAVAATTGVGDRADDPLCSPVRVRDDVLPSRLVVTKPPLRVDPARSRCQTRPFRRPGTLRRRRGHRRPDRPGDGIRRRRVARGQPARVRPDTGHARGADRRRRPGGARQGRRSRVPAHRVRSLRSLDRPELAAPPRRRHQSPPQGQRAPSLGRHGPGLAPDDAVPNRRRGSRGRTGTPRRGWSGHRPAPFGRARAHGADRDDATGRAGAPCDGPARARRRFRVQRRTTTHRGPRGPNRPRRILADPPTPTRYRRDTKPPTLPTLTDPRPTRLWT